MSVEALRRPGRSQSQKTKMEDLEVLRELGRGGFATVYLCREKSSSRLVALKRIPLHRLERPEQKRRAAAETFILEHAQHPFLCRGFRTFQDDEFQSFVMEYIEGARPLYQCIWRYKTTSVFPELVAKQFAVQIVLANEALHSMGFIHRDLKSGNVLVDSKGVARVIDYGFAKKLNSDEDESTGERTYSVCGTHYIMAPEVYLRQSYGVEVDWWSVGVIVHEMVCGRPPWDYKPVDGRPPETFFDSISEVAKGFSRGQEASTLLMSADVSVECKDFIKELLQFNPRKRLGHAGGGQQVKAHAWLKDVDWERATSPSVTESVYDPLADYREDAPLAGRPPVPELVSSSSAESIDPQVNADLFGDF